MDRMKTSENVKLTVLTEIWKLYNLVYVAMVAMMVVGFNPMDFQ